MKLVLIILLGLVALVVALVVIVCIIGAALPKAHVASRSIVLHRSPEQVYAAIHDFASAPKWRKDVDSVEVTQEPGGRVRFREQGRHNTINFEVVEDVPGRRLVTRILDTNLGYSGSWSYDLAGEGPNTRLTITENGEVANVIFRFLSRFVFGHTMTIDTYLTSLATHLGETAVPR